MGGNLLKAASDYQSKHCVKRAADGEAAVSFPREFYGAGATGSPGHGARRDLISSTRVAFLVLVLILTAACSRQTSENSERQGLSLSVSAGSAIVSREGAVQARSRQYQISTGDEISLSEDGLAVLSSGRALRLGMSGARLQVLSPGRFRLRAGRVLAETRTPLYIDAGTVDATARSAVFRLDRGLAARVAVYRGRVQAGAPGDFIGVPAFRQIVVAGDVVPRAAEPLEFSRQDAWDRSLLAKAIDLDDRLANFSRGLEAQLGQGSGLDFFARLTDAGSQLDFLAPYLGGRRPDLLIGLLTAVESLKVSREDLGDRFARIFDLSRRGATWGLIASEFDVSADRLFAALTRAVERSGISVIGSGPGLLRPPAAARPPAARSPAPAPPPAAPARTPAAPAASPTPARTPLLPGLTETVPPALKTILDDLLGVVDPGKTLPGLI